MRAIFVVQDEKMNVGFMIIMIIMIIIMIIIKEGRKEGRKEARKEGRKEGERYNMQIANYNRSIIIYNAL